MVKDKKKRILIVEDEAHLAAGLKINFELDGYEVVVKAMAKEALEHINKHIYDIILLDIMLPDMNGFEFCEKLRELDNFTPIIMLTAKNAAEDRIQGLDLGADDYITKPFELNELLARVRSMLRRRSWENYSHQLDGLKEIHFGNAYINFVTYEVRVSKKNIPLTKLEIELLHYFCKHKERVITREELMNHVWKLPNYPNMRTIDNFVGRLRKCFEDDPTNPKYFISVRGTGYRFKLHPNKK